MPTNVKLIFVVHNHQPVGNHPWVYEEVFQRAYLPFIETVSNFPKFKFGLHISGSLLDWLIENRPDYVRSIEKLVNRGQIELICGPYYEPILPAIPYRDIVEQIEHYRTQVKKIFGILPNGMWVPERVWDQSLILPLTEAGIRYVFLDDDHLLHAGLAPESIRGWYITERLGKVIGILPINSALRFLIPFSEVEQVIGYMRRWAGKEGGLIVFGDDGEKFGAWPGTYETCYKDGRLRALIEKLLDLDWVEIVTPSEAVNCLKPQARVYPQSDTYFAMSKWALPPDSEVELDLWLKELGEELPDRLRFIKGATWEAFLAKYQEANLIHKKMLEVSQMVEKLEDDDSQVGIIKRALWQGQCNCPYWHGVFGGIYLPHLRHAAYSKLIEAEVLCSERLNSDRVLNYKVEDLDADLQPEVKLSSEHFNLYFKPSYGGTLYELDLKPYYANVGMTLKRRREVYHEHISELPEGMKQAGGGYEDIGYWKHIKAWHESRSRVEMFPQRELKVRPDYDWYFRYSLIDHFLHPNTLIDDMVKCRYGEQGGFVDQPYEYELREGNDRLTLILRREAGVWVRDVFVPARVTKQIELDSQNPQVYITYEIQVDTDETQVFAPEFNFAVYGEPPSYGVSLGNSYKFSFKTIAKHTSLRTVELNDYRGFKLSLNGNIPEAWLFPIYTYNASEGGLEKVYQQICIVLPFKFKRHLKLELKLELQSI